MSVRRVRRPAEPLEFLNDFMTVRETAKYLSIHLMTVYRLFNQKKLPCFKIGGRWRTKKSVLDSMAEKHE